MPARVDLVADARTINELATVRLGTAFYRRALDQVTDAGLDAPSLLPGWQRRHLVAHVGYNARAIARLVDWAATGVETPMYSSPQARAEEIELGATLNPEALRTLNEHAAIDLDVRWRDLPADRWGNRVITAQGREVPVSETIWMRTREVWLHAADLDSGARIDDVPRPVLIRLIGDVQRSWAHRGESPVRLELTDARECEPTALALDADASVSLAGALPAIAAWVTGRLTAARRTEVLAWQGWDPQAAPRWI